MVFGRQGRPGLLGTMARTAVITGTAQATTGAIHRRQQERAARSVAAQTPFPPAPPPAAGPPPGGSQQGSVDQLADQLARIAELHATGVLTAEEFAAAKSRLLQ